MANTSIYAAFERMWQHTVTAIGNAIANLEVFKATESTDYAGCYYRIVDGATEWINPPMMPNVEYRTIERDNGNPVYVAKKSIACNNNTFDGTYVLDFIQGVENIVDISAILHDTSAAVSMPIYSNADKYIRINFDISNDLNPTIQVSGTSELSVDYGDIIITLKYTK